MGLKDQNPEGKTFRFCKICFIAMALLAVIVPAGIMGAGYMGKYERGKIFEEARADARTLAANISEELAGPQRAVRVMATAPWALSVLTSGAEEDIKKADLELKRYMKEFGVAVCYLMDKNGTTIASSNSGEPGSFVGKNYSFRPYFKEAIRGKQGEYFALGVTSRRRGYYTSYPLRDAEGGIIGISVIKKELDEAARDFRNYPGSFFVSPEGVVFISGTPGFLFRNMWPLSERTEQRLIESRQFGKGPFEPLFPEKFVSGEEVILADKRFITASYKTDNDWMVVTLKPADSISFFIFTGGVITAFLGLVVISFASYIRLRERSYEQIIESENRFKLLGEATREGVIIHSGGRIRLANRQAASLLGYVPEEMLEKDIYDIVAPEAQEIARKNIKEGSEAPYELTMIRKDGIRFLAEIHGKMLKYKGRPSRMVSIRDITERKRAEEDILRTANEWKTTFDSIPDMISIHDKDQRIVRVNEALARAMDKNPEELVGRPCYEVFHDSDKPAKNCPFHNALSRKRTETEEFFDENLDMYLEVTVSPIISGNGMVLGAVHVAKDITKRKTAEDRLAGAFAQMDQIFQNAGDGMCVIDKDERVIQINNTMLRLLGMAKVETQGKTCRGMFNEYLCEIMGEATRKIYRGDDHFEHDVSVNRRGGVQVPCILTAAPFLNPEGEVVGAIISLKDITERKSAEKALLENIRLKSNFTSMVSHELRTPLTAIKEGIGIVLDGSAGEVNEDQKDFLDTAKRNVDRLSRLINDVLDFTKLRSGRMTMRMKKNDMNSAIGEVLGFQRPVAKEKGVSLDFEKAEDLPEAVFDRDRVIQVITNLVNNALKYTDEGGVTVVSGVEDGMIHVSVRDTGPGIRQEDISKLFHEFQQLEDEKSRKTGSSGLGLAICKEIIDRHNGRIWAESEYGKGSSFNFTIPVERKPKVLVVDDDENFTGLCENVLNRSGFEVHTESTGMKGVESLMKRRPDVVILDMKLPDINGYEIIGRLRSEKDLSSIPILAVSGYVDELDRLEVPKDRFSILKLAKPFDMNELIDAINTLMG